MQTLKPKTACTALAMTLVAVGAVAAPASQSDGSSQLVSVQKGAAQATVAYSFAALDRDHDGGLIRSEIPLDMVDLRMDFQRADYDDSGQLSPVECAMYADGKVPEYTGAAHAWNAVLDAPDPKATIIAGR